MLELTTTLPTSINKLYINQYTYNPKTKRREPTGKRILSPEGRKVKAKISGEVIVQMKGQEWDYDWTKTGYLYQDAVIYFPRRGADDNNIYKLLNDTLEGLVYDNDSRVLVRTKKIMYDSKYPRIKLSIYPVSYVGIFDSQSEADKFESKCKSCSRYRKGACSILKESLLGTIKEEIENNECTVYKEKK